MATATQTRPFQPFPSYESEGSNPQINAEKQAEVRADVNASWESFLDAKTENITRLDGRPEPIKLDESDKIAEAKKKLEELLAQDTKGNNELGKMNNGVEQEIVIENKAEYVATFESPEVHNDKKAMPQTKDSLNIMGASGELVKDIIDHVDFKLLWRESVDFGSAMAGIFTDYIFFKTEKPKDEKAQKTENEKKAKEANKNGFFQQFFDALRKPASSLEKKIRMQQQMEDLNRKFGMNSSFEGIMNSDGTIRTDVETYLAMENSKKTEEQIQISRRKQVAQASKGSKKSGPAVIFDLNKSAESHNSVTQLKG